MAATLKAFNVEINNEALKSKKLPTKLKVLNWGKNTTNDGDVFITNDSLRVFMANQIKAGRDKDVAIDFDHNSVKGSKEYVPGQPKVFAGYGDPVLVKDDGLYLDNIEWTPAGEKFARNYKDLSPAAVLDKTGVLLGLDSVALTPHGAVRELNFFSAGGFDVNMLKEMSVGDRGASNPKPTSEGFVIKDSDYNTDGANPAVKITPSGPEIKELDADSDDKDEYDEHDTDCECANCMAANDPAVGKKHIEEFDSEDHYSKYGDVAYADKENHKYPIDTKAHAKAAWSYINMPKNAKKYSGDKLSTIKSRIRSAAKKHGIEIGDEKTKTMSADIDKAGSVPDAYKTAPEQYKTMNDNIVTKMTAEQVVRKMAAEIGMEDESDSSRVLFAFLAKYMGLQAEKDGQITHKGNTSNGGLEGFEDRAAGSENYETKPYSADISFLKKEIESLKNTKVEDERQQLVRQASREGKIIPLSADEIKSVDVKILKSIIANQPSGKVPTSSTLRTLAVQDENHKPLFTPEQMRVAMIVGGIDKEALGINKARDNSVKCFNAQLVEANNS